MNSQTSAVNWPLWLTGRGDGGPFVRAGSPVGTFAGKYAAGVTLSACAYGTAIHYLLHHDSESERMPDGDRLWRVEDHLRCGVAFEFYIRMTTFVTGFFVLDALRTTRKVGRTGRRVIYRARSLRSNRMTEETNFKSGDPVNEWLNVYNESRDRFADKVTQYVVTNTEQFDSFMQELLNEVTSMRRAGCHAPEVLRRSVMDFEYVSDVLHGLQVLRHELYEEVTSRFLVLSWICVVVLLALFPFSVPVDIPTQSPRHAVWQLVVLSYLMGVYFQVVNSRERLLATLGATGFSYWDSRKIEREGPNDERMTKVPLISYRRGHAKRQHAPHIAQYRSMRK